MLPDMTPPGPCRLSPGHPVTVSPGQIGNLDHALWLACSRSPAFFLDRYGTLYDPLARAAGRASGSGPPRSRRWSSSPPTAWPSSSRRGSSACRG